MAALRAIYRVLRSSNLPDRATGATMCELRTGNSTSSDLSRLPHLFCGIAMPSPDGTGSDAESQKDYNAHNYPVLWYAQKVRAVSQSGD